MNSIQPPQGTAIIEGEIADYWFEDGILVSRSKSILRTVDNITRNIALVKKITSNNPIPLLIYLSNSPIPDKATRKLSAEKLPEIYSAMAMISSPGLSTFIMNLLFRFKQPSIPMKTFNDVKAAKEWLKKINPPK